MKRIDLHVHTISTIWDKYFEFSIDPLLRYVSELKLDAIAITNHNLFDRLQYEEIQKALPIQVFPGIEISLETGHLLIISNKDTITEFSIKCQTIQNEITTQADTLSLTRLLEIFPDLDKYLLIPHLAKSPELPKSVIKKLEKNIQCGEVNSAKKFLNFQRSGNDFTPVLFSDVRISRDLNRYPSRFTCLDIDSMNIGSLKIALSDKSKVSLSEATCHKLIQVLSNGLMISTGLTVILGERSSGKTYTLDEIMNATEGCKYIKQFSLLSRDNDEEEKRYLADKRQKQDLATIEFFNEFRDVVDDAVKISLTANDQLLQNYVDGLLSAGSYADKEDVYSKSLLFNEARYEEITLKPLETLIDAVRKLIDTVEYQDVVHYHLPKDALITLSLELMKRYAQYKELELKKRFVNDLVRTIKSELQILTAAPAIPEVDFYRISLEKEKIKKFCELVKIIQNEHIISRTDLFSFITIVRVVPFQSLQDLKSFSGLKISFSDAYKNIDDPYLYLQSLLSISGLQPSDIYKYFSKVECIIQNQYGYEVSGGERSEFHLMEQLSNASQYEMLLIDEPESSFDNPFLKNNVNRKLKEMSQFMPVLIATHNSTIGASIKPDYLIYTKRNIRSDGTAEYLIYHGHPSNKKLVEISGSTIDLSDILFDCLEAGETTYYERKRSYEMLKN